MEHSIGPTFPEDVEREICEVLLEDVRDMCGAMSLVASRFNLWTKPAKFRTVVVRRHDNWMQRMNDCLLPNAALIRVLVLDLPFNRSVVLPREWSFIERFDKDRARCIFTDEELSSIRRLLSSAEGVRHLAVTWNIWAYLERECGTLRLQSLYLIWDRAFLDVESPKLNELRYPAALEDLTMFAPVSLDPQYSGWRPPEDYLPDTARCVKLAYATYAATYIVPPWRTEHLKGYMAVSVRQREVDMTEEEEDFRIQYQKESHPSFSTLYLRTLNDMLQEWLNKMEGRESLLEHPPPRMHCAQDPRGLVWT
ncbi:hypothetical protein C8R46DRAFT_1275361 [Mycena filopes]|nr:hypothetical protein C8R46DRAFT_1275361 [Mycena filopes]